MNLRTRLQQMQTITNTMDKQQGSTVMHKEPYRDNGFLFNTT